MGDKPATRKITVTDLSHVFTGTGAKGEYSIYNVEAVNEQGEQIKLPLRTFDSDLPRGELIEVTVTPYDREVNGKTERTYTVALAKKRSPGARLGPKVDELRERVDGLEERHEWMLDVLHRAGLVETSATAGDQPDSSRSESDVSSPNDDDVPF